MNIEAKLNGLDLFGEPIARNTSGPVAERFGFPPFSVLDARSGEWQDRKRAWASVGIKGEVGRSENLGRYSETTSLGEKDTSIFDPTLCECAYRWFCPEGGQVVDPFAGGSVRGIVAGMLGRRYWGCDLRQEQIDANNAQADEIIGAASGVVVEKHGVVSVVRDDLTPGGTKERALMRWLPTMAGETFVYASSSQGYAQLALARACRAIGKKAVVFVAAREIPSVVTAEAERCGAEIHAERPGYLSVVQARAKRYADDHGAVLLPFGLDCAGFIDALSEVVRETCPPPAECWSVAGSGTLQRAMQKAWPTTEFHAVQVGSDADVGVAEKIVSPLRYEQDATDLPPYPSVSNYDAKVWQYAKNRPGALIWNVAGPNVADIPSVDSVRPVWVCGDSMATLDAAPDADFIFSCPPYGDLEKYSDDPADLSAMEWHTFKAAYGRIILRSVKALKPDRFACFVVGDFRDNRGFYRDFVSGTIAAFRDCGAELYNEAILVTSVGSASMRVTKQFDAGRKFCKTHQNVLVFCKGDWRKAAAAARGEPS